MSDRFEEVWRHYAENVLDDRQQRSYGLFPIPEYPELVFSRGMWSSAFDTILTTLRYLAPATILTIFWGQQSFFFKLLKYIDSAFRSIVFSSEEQKEAVLKWLELAGPVRVEHLDTVWRHGWIICGVLDAALPGACAGHPPTRLSMKHAQTIADHYLGVEPVFSRQELESNDALSKHQEWKLATYLDRVRQALAKLTPPVSKPSSQRTSPETSLFTLDYVARGPGLVAAQVRGKIHFKIFPTTQQSIDPGEITILIKGPRDTYGMAVLPPILGKAQIIRQKLLGLQTKPTFTENSLPLTHGTAYMRNYGKNDMNKTYYIPKTKYSIEIETEPRLDHARVEYTVPMVGKYEISISSRGQSIVGSPFSVTASNNIIGLLERESFSLEDGDEIDIVDVKNDRKVVLRIVDFVTEKMLLKENGSLEKISNDEANVLMATDSIDDDDCSLSEDNNSTCTDISCSPGKKIRFKNIVSKVLIMNRICKIFRKHNNKLKNNDKYNGPLIQRGIPDIVNSTLNDINNKCNTNPSKTFIVPECLSVSLRTEKARSLCEEEIKNETVEVSNVTMIERMLEPYSLDSLENNLSTSNKNEMFKSNMNSPTNPFTEDFNIGYKTENMQNVFNSENCSNVSSNGATSEDFVSEFNQNYATEKTLGAFVRTEFETHNSQNEESPYTPIQILIDEDNLNTDDDQSKSMFNPFIDPDIINLERPKTPVLKIITGDIGNRDDSIYVDPLNGSNLEEILGNEFINPFFIHQHIESVKLESNLPMADFIIGAPVSLPPQLRASSTEPAMGSLIITNEERVLLDDKEAHISGEFVSSSAFSTPLHTNIIQLQNNNSSPSSTFHSIDSNSADNSDHKQEVLESTSNITPKKDIWDSAYVSIDDSNSSPDSNNNENTTQFEPYSKQRFSLSADINEELLNMGPAERELWETCNELKDDKLKLHEEPRQQRLEIKRKLFTPIIEETDRNISSCTKERLAGMSKLNEADSVTMAFSELNKMYKKIYPNSECNSAAATFDENHFVAADYKIERNNEGVDSASEIITDVKRHTRDLEGVISGVQTNVAESVSVSQVLHKKEKKLTCKENNVNEGKKDYKLSNIVIEKKRYWDEKIRQNEALTEENNAKQKSRKLSSKHLRLNDSLTKKRGKQIVKKILNSGENTIIRSSPVNIIDKLESDKTIETYIERGPKLVDKWKKYWDEKLENEKDLEESTCFRSKSPKVHVSSVSPQSPPALKYPDTDRDTVTEKINVEKETSSSVKQELPEEVFKAFETSPKRFFGTSRKQILSKIDNFLGKQSSADQPIKDTISEHHDNGVVSSRISLYQSISQSEDLSQTRRKCQSMHDISHQKVSDNSIRDKQNLPYVTSSFESNNKTKIKPQQSEQVTVISENSSIKEKRARMRGHIIHKTFDESMHTIHNISNGSIQDSKIEECTSDPIVSVKKTIEDLNQKSQCKTINKSIFFRKSSISKSEMDIFNKSTYKPIHDDDLDKYKSCDELPKTNVKSFITLYESVSSEKSVHTTPILSRKFGMHSMGSENKMHSVNSEAVMKRRRSGSLSMSQSNILTTSKDMPIPPPRRHRKSDRSLENLKNEDLGALVNSNDQKDTENSNKEIINDTDNDESNYISLSDIELEIIDIDPDSSTESTPKRMTETAPIDYKSRFKLAKQYFQSLEELRDDQKPRKLNECEILLEKSSSESIDDERPQKRVKKKIKAHSMPSSEISKIWKQLQDSQENIADDSKLVKISEKFNVEDLFEDVVEGKLSRQGSLRGIPHKKAVLETFRSMENITNTKMSPYEIAVSQLNEFAKENDIKNAQTYLTEYPFLPTTDPSKYRSRVDTKASGLISLKEIKDNKPRRNSVPDLRLNPKFTVKL